MTLSELKKSLLNLVSDHFVEGNVIWAEQYSPELSLPQTTLKLKDMTSPRHPVNKAEDGTINAYYECTKILEINRYENSVAGKAGEIINLENPAVDELSMFLMYLQSEEGIERMYAANICIEGIGPVRDLSALDRTHYRYRAMQEYTVRFVLEYKSGKALVHAPLAGEECEPVKEPIGYFENVEMEDKYE